MDKIAPQVLHQRWLHSHEEDTETEQVFRPSTYRFPPSRGRTGFELKPDGTSVQIGVAPADGAVLSEGTWALDAEGNLHFRSSPGAKLLVVAIASAQPDKLVVKK